jgi:glycosyltransferase involved in cell wall biosynthesis
MLLSETSGKKKPGVSTARLLKTEQSLSVKHKQAPRQHAWKVVHACEFAREILPLVEGQVAVGMRPLLLTPGGFGAAGLFLDSTKRDSTSPISLLRTWNHVREWRRLIHESAAESSAEIIHAHSFSAGMAAVRTSSAVVYQLKEPVEKQAAAAGHCDENSWLARSFRVAEQFVLTRAAAVVVNDHAGRLASLERGVSAENVFCIPSPIATETLDSVPDRKWMDQIADGKLETVYFLIPGLPNSSPWEMRDALLRWMRMLSIVRQEHGDVRLIFIGDSEAAKAIHEIALACNLMPYVKVLAADLRHRAIASVDVVICDREHLGNMAALETLARARALLAADLDQYREITADGRGCLWFRSGDVSDIAFRAIFLASNPQFRRALAVAGREHCLATRSVEVIGAQYDAVYRLAFGKRKGRDSSTPRPQLIPLQVQT